MSKTDAELQAAERVRQLCEKVNEHSIILTPFKVVKTDDPMDAQAKGSMIVDKSIAVMVHAMLEDTMIGTLVEDIKNPKDLKNLIPRLEEVLTVKLPKLQGIRLTKKPVEPAKPLFSFLKPKKGRPGNG